MSPNHLFVRSRNGQSFARYVPSSLCSSWRNLHSSTPPIRHYHYQVTMLQKTESTPQYPLSYHHFCHQQYNSKWNHHDYLPSTTSTYSTSCTTSTTSIAMSTPSNYWGLVIDADSCLSPHCTLLSSDPLAINITSYDCKNFNNNKNFDNTNHCKMKDGVSKSNLFPRHLVAEINAMRSIHPKIQCPSYRLFHSSQHTRANKKIKSKRRNKLQVQPTSSTVPPTPPPPPTSPKGPIVITLPNGKTLTLREAPEHELKARMNAPKKPVDPEEAHKFDFPDKAIDQEITKMQMKVQELYEAGRYNAAIKAAQELLQHTKKNIRFKNHPGIATAHNNLGLLYKQIGRFEESRKEYMLALKIYQRTVGNDHSSYAAVLHNLGTLNRNQIHLDRTLKLTDRLSLIESSIEYLEQAYNIRKNELGPHHANTVASLSSWGATLSVQILNHYKATAVPSQGSGNKNVNNAALRKKLIFLSTLPDEVTSIAWKAAEEHLRQALQIAIENPRGQSITSKIKNKEENATGMVTAVTSQSKKSTINVTNHKNKQQQQQGNTVSPSALSTASDSNSSTSASTVDYKRIVSLSAANAAQNLALFLKFRATTLPEDEASSFSIHINGESMMTTDMGSSDSSVSQSTDAIPVSQTVHVDHFTTTSATDVTVQEGIIATDMDTFDTSGTKSADTSSASQPADGDHLTTTSATDVAVEEGITATDMDTLDTSGTKSADTSSASQPADGDQVIKNERQALLNESYKLYQQIIYVQNELLPKHHPERYITKHNYAELLDAMGDIEAANFVRNEILKTYRPPPSSPTEPKSPKPAGKSRRNDNNNSNNDDDDNNETTENSTDTIHDFEDLNVKSYGDINSISEENTDNTSTIISTNSSDLGNETHSDISSNSDNSNDNNFDSTTISAEPSNDSNMESKPSNGYRPDL